MYQNSLKDTGKLKKKSKAFNCQQQLLASVHYFNLCISVRLTFYFFFFCVSLMTNFLVTLINASLENPWLARRQGCQIRELDKVRFNFILVSIIMQLFVLTLFFKLQRSVITHICVRLHLKMYFIILYHFPLTI